MLEEAVIKPHITRFGQECPAYGAKARERKSAAAAKGKGTVPR